MAITRKAIDTFQFCVASFGQIVLAPASVELSHMQQKTKSEKERRHLCVYLYPDAGGGHVLMRLDGIKDCNKAKITRPLKQNGVLPHVSQNTIALINTQAEIERQPERERARSQDGPWLRPCVHVCKRQVYTPACAQT